VANAPNDYLAYHDHEWGMPVSEDRRLFEKVSLEGFQSGLSWLTILRKREAFRAAFLGFDPEQVARFGQKEVTQMLGNAGIVRHRGKIEAVIHNASRACELIEECGSLAAYFWRFEPDDAERPRRFDEVTLRAMPTTPSSTALSKDLKARGWKFVGPTTMYALMQAMGLVNDHEDRCATRATVEAARTRFRRPV
jgi:DNA-3-methyladenine glycosylase I